MMLTALSMAPIHSLSPSNQNEVQHISGHVMSLSSASQYPMTSSMAHDTDTSTGTKTHTIPLNNHFHRTNAVVSLVAPCASCDRRHVIAMYMPRTNMLLKCHI